MDVVVLLGLATEIMRRQANALGIPLVVHVDDDVPAKVWLDREKIGWAITNLVGSALRHVQGPGGMIDVYASWRTSGDLTIRVRDNGPGITQDRLHNLLVRDRWHAGMALALLMVEDIAIAHGGRLEVSSKTSPLDHFMSVCLTIGAQLSPP